MFPGELFSGGVIFLDFAFDQGVSKNRPKEAQLPSFQALKTARRFFLSTSFPHLSSLTSLCAFTVLKIKLQAFVSFLP